MEHEFRVRIERYIDGRLDSSYESRETVAFDRGKAIDVCGMPVGNLDYEEIPPLSLATSKAIAGVLSMEPGTATEFLSRMILFLQEFGGDSSTPFEELARAFYRWQGGVAFCDCVNIRINETLLCSDSIAPVADKSGTPHEAL